MSRAFHLSRSALLYVAAWLAAAGLFTLVLVWSNGAPSWPIAFLYSLVYIVPAMVVGAPVAWLAPRLIQRRRSPVALVFDHAGLAIAFTSLWHATYFGILWLLGGNQAVRDATGNWWGWQVAYGIIVYGVIAGTATAANSTRQLREREVAAARADALRVRAEMAALRGQLDPHFLFNTLHSITALVRSDPPQAEEALVQFGALLRRVLDWKRDGTDEVSLAEELSFVDGYLALEQLRLGDRLRVERNLAGAALECYVPVFSVQPLVENAIRHAIAPHRAGGVLRLSSRLAGGELQVSVADDGPGADPPTVAEATGTGLSAIRQRLHLRHGSAGRLTVDTAPGRGFTATLTLPAVAEPVLNSVA